VLGPRWTIDRSSPFSQGTEFLHFPLFSRSRLASESSASPCLLPPTVHSKCHSLPPFGCPGQLLYVVFDRKSSHEPILSSFKYSRLSIDISFPPNFLSSVELRPLLVSPASDPTTPPMRARSFFLNQERLGVPTPKEKFNVHFFLVSSISIVVKSPFSRVFPLSI